MPSKHDQHDKYERRDLKTEISLEDRSDHGLPSIKGHAAVFNSLSVPIFGFRERVLPGAFTQTLEDKDDVRALVDHDPSKIIGRSKSRTLKMKEDDEGLAVEISPSDTTAGRDIVESIRRGDVDAMSFGFRVMEDRWHVEDGVDIRELVAVQLFDVSPVSFPAYEETDVSLRSYYTIALQSRAEWRSSQPGGAVATQGTSGDCDGFNDDPESVKRKAVLLEMEAVDKRDREARVADK